MYGAETRIFLPLGIMTNHSKVLVVFESSVCPSKSCKPHARFGISSWFLAIAARREVYVKTCPDLRAVIVEQSGGSKVFLESLQNLQAAHPKLRRVVVSDSSDLFSVIDGLHTGAIDAVVYRPIEPRQLHAAVFAEMATAAAPVPPPQAQLNSGALSSR